MYRRSAFVSLGLAAASMVLWTACHAPSSQTAQDLRNGAPNYDVSCASDVECHPSVALLVGLSASHEPRRCTAALVGERTAVTAGHCVASELSVGGQCEGVWLGFAKSATRDSEWVACSHVTSVSSSSDGLFAPDYAVLELAGRTSRPRLVMARGVLRSGEVVKMVSVTPDRFYDDVHEVRTRRCIVDDGSQLSFWHATTPKSVRLLSSCPIREGNSGAPLLDRNGMMRGLVHAGGPPYFALGLMTESARILRN